MRNTKYARVNQHAIDFIRENNNKYSIRELENILGLSNSIIRRICREHGIKKQHKKFVKYGDPNSKSNLKKRMITFLLNDGLFSYEEIGILMNCSRQNVWQLVNSKEKEDGNIC